MCAKPTIPAVENRMRDRFIFWYYSFLIPLMLFGGAAEIGLLPQMISNFFFFLLKKRLFYFINWRWVTITKTITWSLQSQLHVSPIMVVFQVFLMENFLIETTDALKGSFLSIIACCSKRSSNRLAVSLLLIHSLHRKMKENRWKCDREDNIIYQVISNFVGNLSNQCGNLKFI